MGICVSCRRRDRKASEKRAPNGLLPAKGPAAELLLLARDPTMANSISNIKMTNPIKNIVSKRRKRYIKDGFNLDLAYITDRLIAMGFPAEKLEGVYRNHIDEVYRFLEHKHKDRYKIYNLCAERSYDSSKFHDRVEIFAFEDHAPPNMELIQPFCESVDNWLKEDPRNVAAVHCKAGKGRTGTMVCCYLLYSGQKATSDDALKFYGTKRTHDEKGVTIPSQRRYVDYYASLLQSGRAYRAPAPALHVRELVLRPAPALPAAALELTVTQASPAFKAPTGCHEVRKQDSCVRMVVGACTPVAGDVRVDVYNKPKMMRKERLFHFWFNTFFVANGVGAVRVPPPPDSPNLETFKLTLKKWQIDDAHKDKQHKLYAQDFTVELIVQKQPSSSRLVAAGRAPSPASSASSASDAVTDPDPEPDACWDSGEITYDTMTTAQPYAVPQPTQGAYGPQSISKGHTTLQPFTGGCSNLHPSKAAYSVASQGSTEGYEVLQSSTDDALRPSSGNYIAERSVIEGYPVQSSKNSYSAALSSSKGYEANDATPSTKGHNERWRSMVTRYNALQPSTKGHDALHLQCTTEDYGSQPNTPGYETLCDVRDDGYELLCAPPMDYKTLYDPHKEYRSDRTKDFFTFDASPTGGKQTDIYTGIKGYSPLCNASNKGYTPLHVCFKLDNGAPIYGSKICVSGSNRNSNAHNPCNDNTSPSKTDEMESAGCTDDRSNACYAESNESYSNERASEPDDAQYSPSDIDDGLPFTITQDESNSKKKSFKREDDTNDKGKIPKVSSDHTIADDTKKKYAFFYRKEEDRYRPRLSLGDMRASWREFSGKWSENRKKKDRDDS